MSPPATPNPQATAVARESSSVDTAVSSGYLVDREFVQRAARNIGAVGCAIGLTLMVWTWARAAAMSADGAHYMELAERAWRVNARAGMDWYAGPGYPVAVAWIYGWIGNLDFAGRLTSCVFAFATLAGVGVLGFRMFGHSVAWVSVGLLAVHTTFVRHAVMAETDAAYGCWLVWSILFVWELRHASSTGRQALMASLAAITLGCGYLTRPEAVPLAGLLCLWYLFPKRSLSRSTACPTGRARVKTMSERKHNARGPLGTRLNESDYAEGTELCTASMGRRLAWSTLVALVFLAIASPYLLKLRAELGRWSLSGKERSIVLKFVPDKRNYEEVLELGVTGALLRKPSSILHWLPYHLRWGVPQFVKSLNPIVLILVTMGIGRLGRLPRAAGASALLLWVSVPFILFFFLTFPGRRYFMQAMPQWTILAAASTVQLAELIASWRLRNQGSRDSLGNEFASRLSRGSNLVSSLLGAFFSAGPRNAARRALSITLAAPMLLLVVSTAWGNRNPIEASLRTERAVGERILANGGPGRRLLSFTVAAFYARGERVPLWGPMQGIVRCHGYGQPLSYEDFVTYVRQHRVEYVVLDQDLRADCPDFLDRVRSEDFELVADDIVDQHGPHLVFRTIPGVTPAPRAN